MVEYYLKNLLNQFAFPSKISVSDYRILHELADLLFSGGILQKISS
ncbi:MAG: hypothetical protein ACXAC7_05300 [Candidatus Hodarchaeales archaeon]